MAVSFYDISIGTYLQTLGGVIGFLEKGRDHCTANGIDLNDVVGDAPLSRHASIPVPDLGRGAHDARCVEGPHGGPLLAARAASGARLRGLQQLMADVRDELGKVSRESAEALESKQVTFQIGDFKMMFTAPNFVLSFTLPKSLLPQPPPPTTCCG
jgi:hypothetical protein